MDTLTSSVIALLAATAVTAHDHGPRAPAAPASHQTAAHEHGVGYLDIAADGATWSFAFRAAGDALVGFEHPAGTDEERAKLVLASDYLLQAASLLGLAAGSCQQTQVEVRAPGGEQAQAHPPSAQADASHDPRPHHDEQHAANLPTNQHRAPAGAPVSHAEHADWIAEWTFQCTQSEALLELRIDVFDRFPRLTELRVQSSTAGGQSSAILTRDSRSLTLPAVL